MIDMGGEALGKSLPPGVVIAATLDTKFAEIELLRDEMAKQGINTILIDCGILGTARTRADIKAEQIAALAGVELGALRRTRDRAAGLNAMTLGLERCIDLLISKNRLSGFMAMGGGTNAALAAAAFRRIPFGVPKLIVSTIASGNTASLVGFKDVVLMHSVVDILGVSDFLRTLMRRSASVMAALVADANIKRPVTSAQVVGVTAFGATTAAAQNAFERLSDRGFEVLTFHARGTGGRAAECFMREGKVHAMLDLTTTEIVDEIVGGVGSAGPNRLDAAADRGIPQVLLPGAIDMVNFGPPDTVPTQFRQRHFLAHTPTATLMRSTGGELAAVGSFIARKLNLATAPATVIVPLRGFSAYDIEGGPFFDPDADHAFLSSLRASLRPDIEIIEIDAHINDPIVAECAVEALANLIHPTT